MGGPVQFGQYTLVRKIATGGMAEIYLGRQSGTGGFERFVVIKRILPHLTENPEFVRMFIDEMRVAAYLDHPNIVQIYDFGAVGEQYFISMEYLEGRDLRRIMRKASAQDQRIPLGFALCALARVCEGLYHAHTRKDHEGRPLNLIHRDVSPQNVMATVQGAVKLLDFGIAKAESQLTETRSGVLKGKYSYMSPEQASGKPLDHRSDIFPLGTMLFELTTGRRLFTADNELGVLRLVAEADVPLPSAIDPSYPPDLERIVMKSLALRPEDRYSNCRELQHDLEGFVLRRRLLMSPSEIGTYVGDLFADERAEMEPAAMLPAPNRGEVVSFLEEGEENGSVLSVSGQRRRPASDGGEDTGLTGSLRVLIQEARQRPGLTLGIASALVVSFLIGLLIIALIPEDQTAHPAPAQSSETSPTLDFSIGPNEDEILSFGTLRVESTPPGARIYVDGELQDERAPVKVGAVVVGLEHFVVAEMQGATAQAQRITLEGEGEHRTLRFDFQNVLRPARIELEGLPEGAAVEIDGQARSSGPLSVQPGVPHTVSVNLHGRELLRREVIPEAGEVVELRVPEPREHAVTAPDDGGDEDEALRTGTLVVTSRPPTTVYLGRRTLGSTPVRAEVAAGSHSLRLVNRSMLINYHQRVRIRGGQTLERTIEIPQGQLRVSARPYAEVSINGVHVGRTPLRKVLYAGSYTIVLTNQSLGRHERQVLQISGGENKRIRVDWR